MGILSTELRIGNYVLLKCKNEKDEIGKLLTIDEINGCYYNKATNKKFINQKYDGRKNSWCKFEIINPIPLTEEWLLKFGFENKYGSFLLSTKRGTIQIEEDLAEISSVITHNGFMAPCKHVHQLQNLFYCLCGEELKLIH